MLQMRNTYSSPRPMRVVSDGLVRDFKRCLGEWQAYPLFKVVKRPHGIRRFWTKGPSFLRD